MDTFRGYITHVTPPTIWFRLYEAPGDTDAYSQGYEGEVDIDVFPEADRELLQPGTYIDWLESNSGPTVHRFTEEELQQMEKDRGKFRDRFIKLFEGI